MGDTGQGRLLDSLATAHRRLSRLLDSQLAEEGATVDHWRVLRALGESDGMLMGELIARLGVPGPSLTRIVDSLVDRAMVYRHQSPEDRRRVQVHLSETGSAALDRMDAIISAHEELISEALGRRRFRALTAALEDLCGTDVQVHAQAASERS